MSSPKVVSVLKPSSTKRLGKVLNTLLNRAPKHIFKNIPYPSSVIEKQQAILRAKLVNNLKQKDSEQNTERLGSIIREGVEPDLVQLTDTVKVFNPMGKSKYPVRPIIFLNGLTTKTSAFYSLLRSMNYPYGAAIIELDHLGKHRKLQDKINAYKQALKDLRIKHPAWVVGLDIGGLTAFAAAKQDPSIIPGITLLNGSLHQVEKTLKTQFCKPNLKWDCEFWSIDMSIKNPKAVEFLNNPLVREQNERSSLEESFIEKRRECAKNNKTLIINQLYNETDAKIIQNDVNELHKKISGAEGKKIVKQFAKEWREIFNTPQDMFSLRHPISLINSIYGVPKENDLHPSTHFMDPVNLYYHHHTQYIQDSQFIRRLNVYETLCHRLAAEKIMSIVESSLAPFDVHRDIQETFEWLRQPSSKRISSEERPWSIHFQPHLQAQRENTDKKKVETI